MAAGRISHDWHPCNSFFVRHLWLGDANLMTNIAE